MTPADSLLLARADSALADQLYGPAISLYRTLLSRYPDSFHPRYGIARGFLHQGEPDRALPFLNELIYEFPEEPDPRVLRGYAYLQLGRIDPAIVDFQWVADRYPGYSDAWAGLAHAYRRLGDLRRASNVYDRWIRAEPQNAEAFLGRAQVNEALGRDTEAAADLEAARRFGAAPSDIAAVQDLLDRSDWQDEVRASAGYVFQTFGGRRALWETFRTDILYEVQDVGTVVFEYQRATRYERYDGALRGDVFAELWRQAYIHLSWQHGLEREFLPVNDVYVELFQGASGGWVPSLLFRQMVFPDVRADFYGVGLEKYAGNWLFRWRFSLVDVRERTNPVIQGQIRYYLFEPHAYVQANVGYGKEVLATDAIGSIETVTNTAVGLYAQSYVFRHIGIGVGAQYYRTEIIPNRGGLNFRVMTRF